MSFGRELSHIVEQQIDKALRQKGALGGESAGGVPGAGGSDGGKIALLEANLQRLAEQVATYMSKQKETKRNVVDYGLEVLALHGMRVAITGGKAIFVDQDEPLHTSYMYFELSRGGVEREIRYIYLNNEGKIIESTTDPSNIGETYLPLAMVDVWSSSAEIIQDRIQDIRPRSGKDIVDSKDTFESFLTGNASLQSPDTGNDSFLIKATEPAGLKVKVSAGRALVDGEIVDAEGGILDLTHHRKVEKEFLGISDGERLEYDLYHQSVSEVEVFVDDEPVEVTVDDATGKITFSELVEAGLPIAVSYQFTGNYPLIFLIEKMRTGTGKAYGVIGWKVGSNRNPQGDPALEGYQHAIGKVDLSGSIEAITDLMIDNAYEVINLTQEELQYGEKLGSSSLKDGAIIANKISANAVTANHITAGSIDAAKIKSGSIQANHIAVGAIRADHIGAGTITADKLEAGTITAEKFEDTTWGDMTQAIRYVKSVLKNATSWRRKLSISELSAGVLENVDCTSEEIPTLKLDTVRRWDQHQEKTKISFELPAEIVSSVEEYESEEALAERKKTEWDYGNWDRPVFESGSWESASIDYGRSEDLQAEFWVKPLNRTQAHQIKVKFRYSEDNLTWTEYEEGSSDTTLGYLCWAGNLQRYRYLKLKVELTTTDPMEYELLAYPEVRIATCSTGTVGDIRFPAMTVKDGELKLNGAELDRADYPALWKWAQENNLVVSEATWNGGYQGYFSSGDTMNTFRLPDTRGEFFRVWDEGRGIDKDRVVGTSQGDAIRNIVGNTWKYDRAWDFSDDLMRHTGHRTNIATGSGKNDNWCGLYQFNAGRVVPTAPENRPHNIAYFACIRYE